MSRPPRLTGHDGTATSWPGNVGVTSAEFAYFDEGTFRAFGERGGTYSLSDNLTIGGAFTIELAAGTNLISGFLHATNDTTIDGGSSGAHQNLYVGVYVDTEIAGACHFSGGAVTVDGVSTFNGLSNFDAAVTINADFTVSSGTSDAHRVITFGAYVDTTWHGSTTFAAPSVFWDTEFILARRLIPEPKVIRAQRRTPARSLNPTNA